MAFACGSISLNFPTYRFTEQAMKLYQKEVLAIIQAAINSRLTQPHSGRAPSGTLRGVQSLRFAPRFSSIFVALSFVRFDGEFTLLPQAANASRWVLVRKHKQLIVHKVE
jgi:hypothetical protein